MNSLKNCSGGFYKITGDGITLSKKVLSGIVAFALTACGSSYEELKFREKNAAIADSVSSAIGGLHADTIQGTTHFFARTAKLKVQVTNVLTATQEIEDLVSNKGGYMVQSNITSQTESTYKVRFKEDSLKEVKQYLVVNDLTMRVPYHQLDTVLKKITGLAVFIDYRNLNADDVKMKLFAGQLAERRYTQYKQRLTAKTNTAKNTLTPSIKAEDKLLETQLAADESRIESYDLADRVNYSTITLHLYQQPVVSLSCIARPPVIELYEPAFKSKLAQATAEGFETVQHFILFVIRNWGVFLILTLLIIGVMKLATRIQRKNSLSEKISELR